MLFTLIMAAAAIGTAWAGFESAQWSDRQSSLVSQALAARTQANRQFNEAAQQRTQDMLMFTQWISAVNVEMQKDPSVYPARGYVPNPKTGSGFLFLRLRPEFRPAVDAWIATRPLGNRDAPSTPLAMPEYRLAAQAAGDALERQAERDSIAAQQTGVRAANYTLLGVLFALTVFFAAVGNKADGRFGRRLLLWVSAAALVGTFAVLATFPVAF